MIKNQIIAFLLRWALSTLGMWISISLFGTIIGDYDIWLFIFAGFVFSLVNALVRPLATTFALPLIALTMGLFTILINTAMVAITVWIIPEVTMDFWGATLSSIVMSIANGLVNFWLTAYNKK